MLVADALLIYSNNGDSLVSINFRKPRRVRKLIVKQCMSHKLHPLHDKNKSQTSQEAFQYLRNIRSNLNNLSKNEQQQQQQRNPPFRLSQSAKKGNSLQGT